MSLALEGLKPNSSCRLYRILSESGRRAGENNPLKGE
jgi:hypothetical protein